MECDELRYLIKKLPVPVAAAARLLSLWVRIPTGGMDVCLLRLLCVVR